LRLEISWVNLGEKEEINGMKESEKKKREKGSEEMKKKKT